MYNVLNEVRYRTDVAEWPPRGFLENPFRFVLSNVIWENVNAFCRPCETVNCLILLFNALRTC